MRNIKESTEPRISVVMPAYNAARTLESAILSVLEQSYESFELLVCDDASRDATWKVLQGLSSPKLRLFRNRANLGRARTRNRLLRLARGRYISPCDADDWMLPGNLKTLSRVLDREPETGVVYGDVLAMEMDRSQRAVRPPYFHGGEFRLGRDLYENLVNHSGSLIRRDLMLNAGGYDERVPLMEDYGLWLRLAETTRFKYLRGTCLYVWRRHPPDRRKSAQMDECRRYRRILLEDAARRRFGVDFRNVPATAWARKFSSASRRSAEPLSRSRTPAG